MKANTSKERTHSLLNQGLFYFDCLPGMRDERAKPLMAKFDDCSVSTPRSVKSSVSYEGMVQIRDKNPAWRKGAQFTREEAEALISDERIPLDRRRPLRDPPDPRPAENPDLARPLRRREEGHPASRYPRPRRRHHGGLHDARLGGALPRGHEAAGGAPQDGERHRATGRRASYRLLTVQRKSPQQRGI